MVLAGVMMRVQTWWSYADSRDGLSLGSVTFSTCEGIKRRSSNQFEQSSSMNKIGSKSCRYY